MFVIRERLYAHSVYWDGGEGERRNVNAIATGKFEFLTAVVTSIQMACFITS